MEYSDSQQRPNNQIDMKIKLILFSLTLFVIKMSAQEMPGTANCFGETISSLFSSISVLLTMPKPLTVWITTNCGKFFKKWEYQTT